MTLSEESEKNFSRRIMITLSEESESGIYLGSIDEPDLQNIQIT